MESDRNIVVAVTPNAAANGRSVFRFNTKTSWYATPMRLMGIDYGSKRIGIALSDESGSMAFPHGVIQNDGKAHKAIVALIEEKKVGMVVIGHSLDKEGLANKIHAAVEQLITDLTLHTGLPVHLEPEQFSTQQALRIQGRTSQTDAAAAALILDSFIQRKK